MKYNAIPFSHTYGCYRTLMCEDSSNQADVADIDIFKKAILRDTYIQKDILLLENGRLFRLGAPALAWTIMRAARVIRHGARSCECIHFWSLYWHPSICSPSNNSLQIPRQLINPLPIEIHSSGFTRHINLILSKSTSSISTTLLYPYLK